MSQFDEDIALKRIRHDEFEAIISDKWNVNIGPNGGYVAAIMLNGMKQAFDGREVQTRSVTFHFLSASVPGRSRLSVTVEKQGRTLSTATARLTQSDRTIAIAIATFADAREFFAFSDLRPPVVPPPGKIERRKQMGPGVSGHVPFRDQYDQLMAIGPTPPGNSTRGHVGGWSRFRDHRPFDDLAVVAISDSWYPSIQAKSLAQRMHAPTVDHSVHFLKALPLESLRPEDYLLVEFTTDVANDGYLIEDGCIWSPAGELIARSRQLAIMMARE